MMDALRTIDGRAAAWAPVMLRACSQGGLALLAAYAVTRLLRRLPPAAKTWGWRLAYLKLLLALFWVAPVTLRVLHEATVPLSHARSEIVTAAVPSSRGPTEHSLDPARPATVPGPLVASSARVIAPAAINRPPVWRAALLAAWVAGALLGIARLGKKWRATRRLRAASQPVSDPDVLSRYLRISRDMGLSHPPKLLRGEIVGPLLIGVVRPAVVIPERIDSGLSLMLAHELAHFRRRDTLWALLPAAARVLFWFHPMVWLAEREWNVCTESACDQACLQATRAAPASYGRLLLDMASASCRRPAPLLAVGAAGSRYAIERRLRAMRYFTEWSSRRRWIAARIFAIGSVVTLVPWRLAAQPAGQAAASGAAAHDPGRATTQPASIEERIAAMPADQREALQTQVDLRMAQFPAKSRAKQRPAVLFDMFMNSRKLSVGQGIDCDGVGLISPVAGVLRRVNYKEGDRIKKDDILFEFDDTKPRATVVEAEARLRLAEIELKRAIELRDKRAIGDTEMEKATAAKDVAEAELSIAQQELAETRIHSPLPGIVENLRVISGEAVKVGDYLAGVSDVDSLRIDVRVPADTRLHVGQDLDVFVSPIDRPFRARINFISTRVENGQLDAKATLENRDGLLKPGMSAWVDLGPQG